MLDFDTMLIHVGEFGLYQKILFVFQAPFCIFVTFALFGQVFMVLYPMNYWCESHFECITIDSVATGAQRRNISLAWRNGGLFQSDPCHLNNIDDNFLRRLNRWNLDKCRRNIRAPCVYDDSLEGQPARTSSPSRRNPNSQDYDDLPSPPERVRISDGSEERSLRRKRHYGSFGNRDTAQTFPPTPTTTSTEYYNPISFEGQDGNERGQYGGPRFNENPGRQGYGQSGNGGGSFGQNGYPRPGGGNTGNGRDGYGSLPNFGGQGSGQYESTTYRTWASSSTRSSLVRPARPSTDGLGGSRPSKQQGGRTDVRNAFVGWPEPKCSRNKFRFELGNNSIILADRMQRRFKNRTLESMDRCTVRWNRSDLPYETIVTEGNWWCNAELYTTFAQAVFFLGAILGGFLIGWVADTFGRVPALVIANVLGALGGALSAVSTNVWIFSLFRFITGMAFDNCFTMMYILVLEFCGPSYRTLVANLSIAIFYTLGTLLIPLLAYYISDWRIYALAISLPMLLALLALFFVPESARWLLSKGRTKEATNILRNFAKVNRRKVDDKVFVDFEQEATKLFAQLEQEEEEPSLAAAFRTPRLRRTFMLLIIFWSMIALVYDGHSRNIINLANEDLNVFWMFGIASMTEFPADMLLIFTLDRFGRRWLAFGSMTLSGAFSFIAAAVTPEMRTGFLITAIISRFWVNVAFNIGLQYAAELLPTVIRAQGVNAIHIMGYVASIISPFVAAIGRSNPTLSLILLGAFSITAGFASLFLAETLGEDLPNTLEEAEAFGKNQSFWNCPICAKERPEDEQPAAPSPAVEQSVMMRNALRGSIRGETYRSSIISHSSSGASRRSRYWGDRVQHAPEPTEMTKLRRITH